VLRPLGEEPQASPLTTSIATPPETANPNLGRIRATPSRCRHQNWWCVLKCRAPADC